MQVRLISITNPLIEVENKALSPEGLMAYCARVSSPHQETPDFEKLLSYCIAHKHWSIFEMVDMTVEIVTSRAISPQILRHRSFCFQEFCVAADTEITLELPNGVRKGKRSAYKRTIEHLYRLQERGGTQMPGHVRVFDETSRSFVTAPVKEVFRTGIKPLFRLTLENGRTIDATKEHRFLTREGFQTMEEALGLSLCGTAATWMNTEAAFACNGIPAYQDTEWLSNAKKRSLEEGTGLQGIADSAGVTTHTIRKWLKICRIQYSKKEVASYTVVWNKGKRWKRSRHSMETIEKMRKSARHGPESNLWRGGADRSERKSIADWCNSHRAEFLKEANYTCAKCGSSQHLELHHRLTVVDRPDLAREKDNIEVLCSACHDEVHRIAGHARFWRERSSGNTLTIHWSNVRSVEYIGEHMTYDLEVEHVSHNYIANGIVTHNSQRYAKAQAIEKYRPRRQDVKNRQNSLDDLDPETVAWFDTAQESMANLAMDKYEEALEKGIAKECARVLLPLGTQTKLYMKGSVRSWIHYLEVRTDKSTQKEHRDIADAVMKIFREEFPVTSKALGWG
jgi:thymidylate synthase (FAD)